MGERTRPELHLQRKILVELSRHPRTLVHVNFTGPVYRLDVLGMLVSALRSTGHADAIPTVLDVLQRGKMVIGTPGAQDLLLSVDGRAAAIEVKTDVGVVSDVQKRVHVAAAAKGLPTAVVRSVGEAVAFVQGMGATSK